MKQNNIRFIVILGTFAIIGIIVIQIYWLQKAWSIAEKEFNQTIQISLQNVAEKISIYNQSALQNINPVNQLNSNYYVVNVNSKIDANVLEFYLTTEFSLMNVNLDFEYAIYDCSTDKMVYGNYVNADGNHKKIEQPTDLPKYSDYVYYFGINFPSKVGYLVDKMTIWVFFSTILLFAVAFFSYALFIILRQKRLSEMQKDFINNMTHEFKTPISTINIAADVLLNPSIIDNPKRLSSYASIIKQENTRLNKQVEKVLQIARIEKRGFDLNKENVDIHQIIREATQSIKLNTSSDTCTINNVLKASAFIVNADKLHLTNLIHNLLDNSVKYRRDILDITVTTQNIDTNKLDLIIEDNGIGMSHEYLKKVFNKFYRIPTGNVHNVKGFGLGLYYVNNICRAHKWKIKLESQLDKGSKFTITIASIEVQPTRI